MLKFIADVNLEKPIVDWLLESSYDVQWIPDYDCGMTDDELLYMAAAEKRILVTNDKDFGELTFRQKRLSSGIILFRLKGQSTQEKVRLAAILTAEYGERLSGHFTVVTRKRIKTIPLEEEK